jgi:hypothetical protein
LEWIKKLVRRVAEEVHRSKIEELSNRILEMEKDYKLIKKILQDSEHKIKDLEEKLYSSTIIVSKMEATINTVIMLSESNKEQLKITNDDK